MKRFIFVLFIIAGVTAAAVAQSARTAPFRQEGIASWYGEEFDGNTTASGEPFDSSLYTAAHPTLPFNTHLMVTNTQNGRRVTVRVNDRGPTEPKRIIDLSAAAGDALDMLTTGTAPVVLEAAVSTILGPMTPVPITTPAAAATAVPSARTSSATAASPVRTPSTAAVAAAPSARTPSTTAAAPAPVPADSRTVPLPELPSSAESSGTIILDDAAEPEIIQPPPPIVVFVPSAPAEIRGGMPPAMSGSLYRLQIGSYLLTKNAQDTFNKLKNAGLSPSYERSGEYNRVVLAKLKPGDIPVIAQILGSAGFPEAIIMEEREITGE